MSKITKIKRSITMILTLLLLVSAVPSYGAKPTFSDIKGHWANEYIESMAAKGYLDGFPGGTFEPQGNLTLMQAISTLSRFAEPTASEKSNAINGYAFLFDELKITQDWEKSGLAVALFKNILTEKEVRDAKNNNILNKPVNRERTSELLVKAMGLEELAKGLLVYQVDYKDIKEVSSGKVRYLKVLLDAGILDPNGKGNNEFQPKANLTRAEMSKLLSEASSYLKRNPVQTEPVEYEYVTDVVKRITVDAGTMLVIENKPYDEKGYRIDNNTSITLDGKKSDLKSLAAGQEVRLKIIRDTINIVSLEAFSSEETVNGVAKYVSTTNDKITLEYKDDNKILTKDYYVDTSARIYLNDKLSKLKDLKDGDLVELKVKNNTITEIQATSKVKKITGIITDIVPLKESKETFYLVTIEDKDEITHKYLTDSKTDIYRKDKRVDGKELKLKDEAYIDGEYDLVEDVFIAKLIDADVVKRKIKGQVTETINRVNQNTIVTIENRETRNEESYDLASKVDIIIDGKSVASLPLDPGYYAELELEGDEIVEIYVDTKRAQESITGRIVDIDRREKVIYLEDNNINYDSIENNDEVVIYTTNNLLISYGNLKEARFEDLKIGDIVMVGGVYKGRNFEANLIIIR